MSFDQSELFCPIHLRLYFFRKHFIFLQLFLAAPPNDSINVSLCYYYKSLLKLAAATSWWYQKGKLIAPFVQRAALQMKQFLCWGMIATEEYYWCLSVPMRQILNFVINVDKKSHQGKEGGRNFFEPLLMTCDTRLNIWQKWSDVAVYFILSKVSNPKPPPRNSWPPHGVC